jgi:DAK2 domain fusion protein YloV
LPGLGTQPTPAGGPAAVDGARFRELLNAGLTWLDRHHEIVNALNVFPVPDGDTGTNMLLTMKSACREITDDQTRTVGAVAKAAAHGALMGARGNSGVILSQILRGMSRSLDDLPTLNGQNFAAALAEGSRIAYKGVNRPVEGTILTVVREAAAAAESAAQLEEDLPFVMLRALRAADEAVANTPKLLPVLAQAGKVDSGGKGLFFILEGIYRDLMGERMPREAPAAGQPPSTVVAAARPVKGQRELPGLVYGFDVQFLVEGKRPLDVSRIREQITALGECPLVEGDEALVKVHVHVPDPGPVLTYAVGLGFVTDVVVENMDDMHIPAMPTGYDPVPPRFEGEPAPAAAAPAAEEFELAGPIEGPGILTVAPGAGLAHVFRSVGAHLVISGGQTMNPSTQDLLEGLRRLPADEVIILPNNGNIIMAAHQAEAIAAAEGKTVAVVPSKSIPQGISALLALNPHVKLEHIVKAMTSALDSVQTGEVTVAVQDARFDGIEVHAGDVIGLLNDRLTATGANAEEVVTALLEQMDAASLEVITLYYGASVTADEAASLRESLRQQYSGQEIEVVAGGQPYYHYIISAE